MCVGLYICGRARGPTTACVGPSYPDCDWSEGRSARMGRLTHRAGVSSQLSFSLVD